MAFLRSIITVSSLTMVSRFFGFARDIIIAATLGAGMVADAFFVALKLPNLFRRLFAEGAFSMAFVPIFAGILEKEGEKKAKEFAGEVMGVLFISILFLVLIIEISMPWVMMVFAPGFIEPPEKFNLTVEFTRITFPYILLISLISLLAGVLNSFGKFAAAAATPILFNLCLIGSVLFLVPFLPSPGHALVWGVFLSGFVQLLWMIFNCFKNEIWFEMPVFVFSQNVCTFLKRVLPVAMGAGIYQINLLTDTIIASFLPEGSISYLFFADRVNQLPLGVVGVAVGTALLPLLSRQIQAGDERLAQNSQNRAIEVSILIALPASLALVLISEPLIQVLFQRGEFGAEQVNATATALSVFALGLPAYVLIKALAPGFFSRGDTSTPVKIAAMAMFINIILSLILMKPLLHVGIALATVVSSWFNASLMALLLYRRGNFKLDTRLKARFQGILLASVGMGVTLYFLMSQYSLLFDVEKFERIVALLALVFSGLITFGVLALITGAVKFDDIRGLHR